MKMENDNVKIYRPDSEVKAAIFIVHGMQEHQNRYAKFAGELQKAGIGVVTYDLPGHGQHALDNDELGWFGEEDGWQVLIQSAFEISQIAKHAFPNVPTIYFGHSMGTMIGRNFLQKYDGVIDGMVLSGPPAYNPSAKAGIVLADVLAQVKGKRGYSKLLDQLVTGKFNRQILNPKTNVDWLSYNEENVQNYIRDPLCGKSFTIQGYKDLFILMDRMHDRNLDHCRKPHLPILLFAGKDDPCIGGEDGFCKSIAFLKNVGYENSSHRLYENCRHESLHENIAQQIIDDIVRYIEDIIETR